MNQQKLAAIRQQCPVLDRVIYLNTGTCGPMPQVCMDAMQAESQRHWREGRASIPAYKAYLEQLVEIRQRVGAWLGASGEDIALTHHTTEGMNIALWGLDWRPGDVLVTSTHEHQALLAPLAALHRRFGVEVRYLPFGGDPERDIPMLQAVCETDKVRMVALSHVSYIDGFVFPIAEISACCRAFGAALLVDGAQSLGAIPVDVEALGIDIFAAPGQKWLCGPEGTGILYISKHWRQRIHPTFCGIFGIHQLSSFDQEAPYFLPSSDASRYHSGGFHRQAIFGLDASLRWLAEDVGRGWALSRAKQLTLAARKALEQVPGLHMATPKGLEATLLSFRLEGRSPVEVRDALDAQGILLRDIPFAEPLLRISVGFYNTEDEIDRLCQALST